MLRNEYLQKEGVEKVWPLVFLILAILLWVLDGWVLLMFSAVKNKEGLSVFAWAAFLFFTTCGAVGFSGIAFMAFSIRQNAGRKYDSARGASG